MKVLAFKNFSNHDPLCKWFKYLRASTEIDSLTRTDPTTDIILKYVPNNGLSFFFIPPSESTTHFNLYDCLYQLPILAYMTIGNHSQFILYDHFSVIPNLCYTTVRKIILFFSCHLLSGLVISISNMAIYIIIIIIIYFFCELSMLIILSYYVVASLYSKLENFVLTICQRCY